MTLRKPKPSEMDTVYLAGFDTWSEGMSPEVYLNDCRSSEKYKQGEWWVLEKNGAIVSSLISYQSLFGLPEGSCGIGSVATPTEFRRQGNASALVELFLKQRESEETSTFFLFSDINPKIYRRLGFVALPNNLQKYPDSICMVKGSPEFFARIESGEVAAPRYF